MKRADRRPLLLLVLVASLGQAPGMTVNGAAGEGGSDLASSNQFLELHFQRQGERVAATALVNRIAGRTIHLAADDFALKLEGRPTLHAENFTVREVAREKLPAGQRLTLHLVQGGGTSKVALVYELLDDSFFLRRHVEFSPGAPVLLREVEVWKVGLEGRCSHQETGPPEEMLHNVWGVDRKTGFGKPVFLEDTFWGLEFPAGYNHYACGYLTLSHLPGRKVAETFISKTAVLGVAPPDQVARHFRSYIEQGRSCPRQPKCLDPSPAATEFKCGATIAGIAVPATAIQALVGSKTTLRPVRELPWQKAALTMEFGQPLPAAPVNPLPFPSALEFQRQVLTLQPLKAFL